MGMVISFGGRTGSEPARALGLPDPSRLRLKDAGTLGEAREGHPGARHQRTH